MRVPHRRREDDRIGQHRFNHARVRFDGTGGRFGGTGGGGVHRALTGAHETAFTAHGRARFGSAGRRFDHAVGRFGHGVNGAVNTRPDGAHGGAFTAHDGAGFGFTGAGFSGGGRRFRSGWWSFGGAGVGPVLAGHSYSSWVGSRAGSRGLFTGNGRVFTGERSRLPVGP